MGKKDDNYRKVLDKEFKNIENENMQYTVDKAARAELMKYDEVFKGTFKYAGICAMILKYLVPEFSKKSIEEILRHMRSDYLDASDAFQSEFPLKDTKHGGLGTKQIEYDLRFDAELESTETNKNVTDTTTVTVNFIMDIEMQGEYDTNYPMVSRAMYYACNLMRDSLKVGDVYTRHNRVYSIWFCGQNEIERLGTEEEDCWFHRYSMMRTHMPQMGPADNKQQWYYDRDADIMTLIFIDLTKIKNKTESELLNTFSKLFQPLFCGGTLEDFKKAVLNYTGIDLDSKSRVREGVTNMFEKLTLSEASKEAGIEIGIEKGRAEGIAEGMKMGEVKGMTIGEEKATIKNIRNTYRSMIKKYKQNEVIEILMDSYSKSRDEINKIITANKPRN